MIKPEQIPYEVINKSIKAYDDALERQDNWMRQAIAAAINAWPGASLQTHWNNKYWLELPLPQEKNND